MSNRLAPGAGPSYVTQSSERRPLSEDAMDQIEPGQPATEPSSRQWPWFLAGSLLFILGPVGYAIQLRQKNLLTPWYVPILATLGLGLMIVSLRWRGAVLRALIVSLFAFVCVLEWFTLAVALKSPAYTGPARPGREVPEFTATLAGGQPFTERDIAN